MKFEKYKNNPILKPNPNNQWEELCVLNPAAIYNEEDKLFYMVYRAAGMIKLILSIQVQRRPKTVLTLLEKVINHY